MSWTANKQHHGAVTASRWVETRAIRALNLFIIHESCSHYLVFTIYILPGHKDHKERAKETDGERERRRQRKKEREIEREGEREIR